MRHEETAVHGPKVFEELLRRFNEENNEEAGVRAAILAGPEPSAHVRRLRENIAVFHS